MTKAPKAPDILHQVLCALVTLMALFCLSAHSLEMRFDRVQLDENLRDQGVGAIKAITQDKIGFIWIGAEYGLVRFDGKQFTRYAADPNNPRALFSNYINDMLLDRSGNLWIATEKALHRYNPHTDNFTAYLPANISDGNSNNNNRVAALAVDQQNNLILALDVGIAVMPPLRDRIDHFTVREHEHSDPVSVQAVFVDRDNTIWLGTKGAGTAIFDLQKQQFHFYRRQRDDPSSLISDNIISIHQDLQGNLWFGAHSSGVSRLEPGLSAFKNYRYDPTDPTSISDNAIWDIYTDSKGNVWLATDHSGLARYNSKIDGFDYIRHQAYNPNSLSTNQIRTLYEDMQGNLWVGLFPNGVNYYNRAGEQFVNYRHQPDNPGSLSHSAVLSFFEDRHGTLWVGTEDGLNAFDRHNGLFHRYLRDANNPDALQASPILSINEDRHGNLWVGTWSGGAHRMARSTGRFQQYSFEEKNTASISNNIVWAMTKDQRGRLWLGTEGGGLNLYLEDSDSFRHFRHNPSDPHSINSDFIWTMMTDRRGQIWIGTTAGLTRFDPETLRFENFAYGAGDPKTFPSERVRSFLEDDHGRIWIGTQDDGFYIFEPGSERFTHYGDKTTLPALYITGFVQDNGGAVWASTTNGLVHIQPDTMAMTPYNNSHGLVGNNFNREANFIAADGTIYFGGTDGFSAFHPENLQRETRLLPMVITNFRIFNQPVRIGEENSPLREAIWLSRELTLDHTHNMFSFEFSALEFRQGLHQEYAYKMEGFDQDWIYIGQERSATFTNLNPGRYTFKVKTGVNNEWRKDIAQVRVTILPAPWKTPGAYLFYALMILALMVLIANTKIKQVELASERQINRELKNLNNIKDSFLANTSHELRTPLNGIIGIAENLSEHFAGRDEYASHHLHLIASSGKRLANLINDILDYSKLANRNLELYQKPIDMRVITETVFTLLAPLTVHKPIQLINEFTDAMPLIMADENRLQQILINLVGNGIKYSDRGSVSVGMQIKDDTAEIYVADSGIGIAAEQTDAIFEAFSQIQNSNVRQYGGTGLGLAITRQLVELHGGTIRVESDPGKGSRFIFTLAVAGDQNRETLYQPAQPSSKVTNTSLRRQDGSHTATIKRLDKPRNAENQTVLIVDDDPVNRMVLQGMLKLHDYRVLEAENGAEAIEMVQKNPQIDLIIMDVMMPKMTGYEACRTIRQTHSFDSLPIIFLTARKNVDEDIEACFSAGGNDYLTKPVSKHDLLPRVANHLRITGIIKKFRADQLL
jgi:two-component system sensor histidine kinase ChiS